MFNNPCGKFWEVMLLGEANREAPAQAELRPTCAGAPSVNLHLIITPMGFTLVHQVSDWCTRLA